MSNSQIAKNCFFFFRCPDALRVCEQGGDDPIPQQEEVSSDQSNQAVSGEGPRLSLEDVMRHSGSDGP